MVIISISMTFSGRFVYTLIFYFTLNRLLVSFDLGKTNFATISLFDLTLLI